MSKKSEVSGPAFKPNAKKETGNSGGKAYRNPANDNETPNNGDDFGGVAHDLSAGAPKGSPVGGLKDVSVPGSAWDGAAVDDAAATDYRGSSSAGRTGKPTTLNDDGGVEPGGIAEADAALGEFGAKVGKGQYVSSILNGPTGDRGEKIALPSEGDLNSANQREWNG